MTADAPPRAELDAPGLATSLDLAEVYRCHAGFVWRVVRRLGVPDAALEDVVHDVFLVVHRRLSEYDGRAALTTWLFGIARGVASNHRRGIARAQRKLAVVEPPGGAPSGRLQAASPTSTTQRSEARVRRRCRTARRSPTTRRSCATGPTTRSRSCSRPARPASVWRYRTAAS